MVIRPGEGLCKQFTFYVGPFFVKFFTEMAIESRWLGENLMQRLQSILAGGGRCSSPHFIAEPHAHMGKKRKPMS